MRPVSADAERARELLREIGLDVDEPFVVFAPGAAYGRAKQWLPERFAELADLIINERGWSVLMVGSNADRAACADITSRLPQKGTRMNRLIDFCGRSDLRSLAGVLSLARAVVSNDSGAMHLAGAVGTKVVAIFGATNEHRTSPLTSGPARRRSRRSSPTRCSAAHVCCGSAPSIIAACAASGARAADAYDGALRAKGGLEGLAGPATDDD